MTEAPLHEDVVITLVDAPEKSEDVWVRETQRTYKVALYDKAHTVRIRFDFDVSAYAYVIENLVGGKWHKLLTGETDSDTGRSRIPFDQAAIRAAKVLL